MHDTQPRYEEIFLTSQGQRIALSVWYRHSAAATALFCPSTMASPLLHRFFLEELWRLGLNVIGLHPVGHGLASRAQKVFVFDDLVQNSLDAAQWIRAHFSGPLVVTGHSQGGILALAHALRNPHLAAAMPICTLIPTHEQAPSVTLFAPFLRYRKALLGLIGVLAQLMPRLPVPMPLYLSVRRVSHGAHEPKVAKKHLRATYPLAFIHSLFTAPMTNAAGERRVKCPFILFSARNDALFPPALMQTMLDNIDAPLKKLLFVEGGGHVAPFSSLYATQLAALMAGQCAALGLPLYHCSNEDNNYGI